MHWPATTLTPRCRAALLLVGLAATACRDGTGPAEDAPPGTRLLASPEFIDWTWHPGGEELLYIGPYNAAAAGTPARLDAVAVTGGSRRTVATAPAGATLGGAPLAAAGAHVYFSMYHLSSGDGALYRARLAGAGAPEKVFDYDSVQYEVFVSPDEHAVAWLAGPGEGAPSTSVVAVDVATGARRAYPLEHPGGRLEWSPDGRSLVVGAAHGTAQPGLPFQWLDLESGSVLVWLAGDDAITTEFTWEVGWDGAAPMVYTSDQQSVSRYSFSTGTRETLASPGGSVLGWSPDFASVVVARVECLAMGNHPLGGEICVKVATSVDRVAWRSGERTSVLRYEGRQAIIGRLSPTGAWLAYQYGSCGGDCAVPGDGLYVVPVR